MKNGLRIAGVVALFSVATAALAGDPGVCLAPAEVHDLASLIAAISGDLNCLLSGLLSA